MLELHGNTSSRSVSLQSNSKVTEAEVLYGIKEEMAVKLSDIVFRRTDLGMHGYPGERCPS